MKKTLLTLAAMATLSLGAYAQGGAPLYATGDFAESNWAADAPVEFAYADGQYTLKLDEVNKLKISTVTGAGEVDPWAAFNSGCLSIDGGAKVEPGETMNLVAGDADIVLPWKGEWTIVVNGELTTLVATTTTEKPDGYTKIYVRGDMNGWGAEEAWEMKTNDGNTYILRDVVIPASEEWKIADADWAVVNYGVAEAGEVLVLDEPFELVSNGANCILENDGDPVDLYFTLSNATLIVTAHSDAEPLYSTGDFDASNWNPGEPVMFSFIGGEYVIDIANVSMFKVSTVSGAGQDDAWAAFNEGAVQVVGRAELIAGEKMALEAGDGNIVVPWRGDWHIVISADLSTIVATTETPQPQGPAVIYLRGDMNGWNAEDDWKFSSEDGETFVLNGVVISEDEEWKIADADWAKINYGVAEAGEMIVLEEPFELEYNGANIKIDYAGEAVDAVDVVFTLSDHTVIITVAGGINDILSDSNSTRTYYNLQGVEVANPTTGIYLIKQGDKVTKAYIIR